MANVIDRAEGIVTPEIVDKIAASTGESPENTRKALRGALPTILAGFAHSASTPDGASSLLGTLRDGRYAYFIAKRDAEPVGFALLRDFGSPERSTLVKRIAVTRPGLGFGRAFLAKLAAIVFEETDAWRLWLGLFPENLRARKAYEAAGFQAEGIARGSAFFDGVFRDELIMALLRPDWERMASGE